MGGKYPLIMNELYNDKLNWDDVSVAKANLIEIEQEYYQNTRQNMLYGILMIYHKNLRGGQNKFQSD